MMTREIQEIRAEIERLRNQPYMADDIIKLIDRLAAVVEEIVIDRRRG